MKTKTLELVGIRLDPQLKKALRIMAEQDQRTFSNYVVKLLTDHVEKSKPRRNGSAIGHEKEAVA